MQTQTSTEEVMPIRGAVAMIDDDWRVREAIESLLVAQGYEVELYTCAEEFMEARGYLMIDCVISDYGLPGMTGGDLATWIEGTRPALPIILISGRDIEGCRSTSAPRVVLEKPFAAGLLVTTLEQTLTRGINRHL